MKLTAYQTADEFVECAIQMLHEQEEWLSATRGKISGKIDVGYAAIQRGELIEGDQVREQMAEQKRAWLSHRKRPGMTLYRFMP